MKNKNLKNITLILTTILLGVLSSTPTAAQEIISITASGRGNPYINFTDGKLLAGDAGNFSASGATNASAVASADFDADGVADLAIAYKTENGGLISIRRGNADSIFPTNSESSPAPFFAETRSFELPFAPDYLAAGDFNADGIADLLAAKRGASNLILLDGNADSDFAAPQVIELGGKLTAFATGEMNNFDNLADVAVGIMEKDGARILIFQNRAGAFSAKPETLEVKKAVFALVFGELDASASHDLIAAAGDELVFVSGSVGGKIENKNVSRQKVGFQIAALAVGDFVGERENEIALLSNRGELFVEEKLSTKTHEENTKKTFVKTSCSFVDANSLIAAKVSTRQKSDLIIGGANSLNIVTGDGADNLSLAAMFDGNENPVAVLPMRLNKDALNDLVVLTENKLEPTILLTAPTAIRTVTTVGDSGSGSLREAVEAANANPGLDEIRFAVPDPNSPIATQTALPIITDSTTLDATTQNGFSGEPIIEIQSLFNSQTSPVLLLQGRNSVLRGFVLKTSSSTANIVKLEARNIFVEGNFIGTSRAGTVSSGNALHGIEVASSGNVIGGATVAARNIISGAAGVTNSHGVFVTGGNNRIEGNYIGADKTGLLAVPNNGSGVYLSGNETGNVVGGEMDNKRNVISGNTTYGVLVKPSAGGFSDAVVENNYIGTNKNGDAALGNLGGGIRLEYAANGAPTATAQAFDNVISGNTGDGVYAVNTVALSESNAAPEGVISDGLILGRRNSIPNPLVEAVTPGNRIGTNAAGTAALPNTGNGVRLENVGAKIDGNVISANAIGGLSSVLLSASANVQVTNNFIGTDASGNADLGNGADGINLEFQGAMPTMEIYGNVISGNNGDGIRAVNTGALSERNAASPTALSALIISMANRIGLNAAGTAALGNSGNGIFISDVKTKIGGAATADGNQIAYNGARGVVIFSGTNNLIRSNSIFSNARLDVDLGGDGTTVNDPLDADEGANGLQNYPTLAMAGSAGANLQIVGAFNSKPNNPYLLVFYSTANCTGAKSLAAQNQVGTTMLTTDANGNAPVNSSFATGVPVGQFITSNAIDLNSAPTAEDNTSEFSPCVAVGSPTPTPTPTPTGTVSGRVTYTNAPTTTGVPFTTINAAGSIPLSTTTDANGFYSLSGFGSGAYTITPSKANQVNGISNLDASRIAQHIVGLTVLNANQLIAADTSGNGSVSSLDASYIAQFVASIANPSITGTWKFLPASRSYPNVLTNQTNQDFSAILMGDVTGNWTPSGPLYPELSIVDGEQTTQTEEVVKEVVKVTAETSRVGEEKAALTINLTATETTGKDILGYQFDLLYDAEVITPQAIGCDVSDTISRDLTAICHASESGVLKVVVFGATPLSSQGTLLKLNFNVVGATGSTPPLRIRNFMFDEDPPQTVTIDGQVLTADSTKQ